MTKSQLLSTAAAYSPPAAKSQHQRSAFSVPEFCEAHGLSISMLYKLWARREGPDIMKAGARTLISVEAAARWRKARERAALKQTNNPGDDAGIRPGV